MQADIKLLLSPDVEDVFRASAGSETASNILDLDDGKETNEAQERSRIGQFVTEIEQRLGRLNKIARERSEVLKERCASIRGVFTVNTLVFPCIQSRDWGGREQMVRARLRSPSSLYSVWW